MLNGVTIRRPETVLIDSAVKVGMDTVIEPFAQLLGSTVVGEDSSLERARFSEIVRWPTGCESLPYTIAPGALFRDQLGARIGPFARLRPDNHVEANTHIGNFVEL